jgi:HK97 family phage portal protein
VRADSLVAYDLKDPAFLEFIRSGGVTPNASGANVNANSAMAIAVAWRCISIVTGMIGSLPWSIKQRIPDPDRPGRTIRTDATNHPMWKVLRRPNRYQTSQQFRKHLQLHLLLRGNAYAYIVRSMGRIVALLPLHPDRCQPEAQKDASIKYRYTHPDQRQEVFNQEEVLHLRGMTMDGINGLSVLTYARHSMGLSIRAEEAGARLFSQGNLTGGYFAHPGALGEEAYERLKEELASQYGGAENAHRIMLLEEGLKFERIGLSAVDAQFLQIRGFQRTDIGMFFGVPPHLYGDTEKTSSWGTGVEQMTIGFVVYTMTDWAKTWEEGFNFSCLNDNEFVDYYHHFNMNALLRGDLKARTEHYVSMHNIGVYSPNDIREKEDENPREGGDEYFVPMNMASSGGGDDGDEARAEAEREERVVRRTAEATRAAVAEVVGNLPRPAPPPPPPAPPPVPAPNVNVTAKVFLPKEGPKVMTVTKHDDKGRIIETRTDPIEG